MSTAPNSPLPTRRLGTTDMEITRVGFGAWAIGGHDWLFGWGPQPDDQSIGAIRRALELGVNWIDTAAIYGLGHSEEMVARAIADLPTERRPYVFTKCGQVWDPADRQTKFRVGKADSIKAECEASLRRLGVEAIDLYQMHWPAEDGTEIEEYWQALVDLKAEGKVRAIGLSNHDAALLARAEAIGHVDTLQPPLSAIHRSATIDELPWCMEHGTGVVAYAPMQSGLLTGNFTAERVAALPASDWRSRHPDFTTHFARNIQVVEAMRPLAAQRGVSPGVIAIGWVLSWPAVTGAIVGGRSPEQVEGWIAAATLELTVEEITTIGDAIAASGAGDGPAYSLGTHERIEHA